MSKKLWVVLFCCSLALSRAVSVSVFWSRSPSISLSLPHARIVSEFSCSWERKRSLPRLSFSPFLFLSLFPSPSPLSLSLCLFPCFSLCFVPSLSLSLSLALNFCLSLFLGCARSSSFSLWNGGRTMTPRRSATGCTPVHFTEEMRPTRMVQHG